ncbi:DUF992 domain-containing protein [Rhodoligotrophos ferricapiens]|uniref:DUF992 domain-containing protein n=1 Tax=Rhodoligotrophos ferricapiens TaxID=3069264 RepID=UPI00315DA04D
MPRLGLLAASLAALAAAASPGFAADLYIPSEHHSHVSPAADHLKSGSGTRLDLPGTLSTGDPVVDKATADLLASDAFKPSGHDAATPAGKAGSEPLSKVGSDIADKSASRASSGDTANQPRKTTSETTKPAPLESLLSEIPRVGHTAPNTASGDGASTSGKAAPERDARPSPSTDKTALATPTTSTGPTTTPETLEKTPATGKPLSEYRNAGQLTCDVATGVGLIIGSSRKLDCTFTAANRATEHYDGHMDVLGLDVGVTGKSTMTWNVLSPTDQKLPQGSLAGRYSGATAEATAGVGVGSKSMLTNNNSGLKLEPVSMHQTGIDVSGGATALTLNYEPK